MISKRTYAMIAIGTGALITVLLCRFWAAPNAPADGVLFGGRVPIAISLAETSRERERGLSGTLSLAPHTGKFFIFDAPGRPGFWMKDMRYPLDLVWIDAGMRVVAVTANIAPETYPTTFFPPVPVRFVLELNAGEASALALTPGVALTSVRP